MRVTCLLFALLLSLGVAAPALAQDRSRGRAEAAEAYLPTPNAIPEGFEQQRQYDRVLEETGITRVIRLYTRDHPEIPTDQHASILLSVAVSDSVEAAMREYQDVLAGLQDKGYGVTSLDGAVGEQALGTQWDLFPGTDHPKTTGLVHYRSGSLNISVQWTDDLDKPVLQWALSAAQALESREPLGRPHVSS